MADQPNQVYTGDLLPSLDMWFVVEAPVEQETLDSLRQAIASSVSAQFRERLLALNGELYSAEGFGSEDLFEIQVYEGSLAVWLRLTPLAVLFSLNAINGCVSTPPTYQEEVDAILKDAQREVVRETSQKLMTPNLPRKGTPREELQHGEIVNIDRVLGQYKAGAVPAEYATAEIVAVLEKVQASPQREELTKAIVRYIDRKYGIQFDWEGLRDRLREIAKRLPPRGAVSAGSQPPGVKAQNAISPTPALHFHLHLDVDLDPSSPQAIQQLLDDLQALKVSELVKPNAVLPTAPEPVWVHPLVLAWNSGSSARICIQVYYELGSLASFLQLPAAVALAIWWMRKKFWPRVRDRAQRHGVIRRARVHPGEDALEALKPVVSGPTPANSLDEVKEGLDEAAKHTPSHEARDDIAYLSQGLGESVDLSQD